MTPEDLLISDKHPFARPSENGLVTENDSTQNKLDKTESLRNDKKTKRFCKNTDVEIDADKPTHDIAYPGLTIVVLCAANFICFGNFSIPAPIFPSAAMKKGMSQSTVGLVIGLYNLVVFIFSPIVGVIIGRVGVKFLLVSGALFNGSCGILFGFIEYGPPGDVYTVMTFLVRGMAGLGCATFVTAVYSYVVHIYPDKATTYFSLLGTTCGLGVMTGPPIAGVLYEAGGYYLPYVVMGSVLILAGLIVWAMIEPVYSSTSSKSRSHLYFICRPATLMLVFNIFIIGISFTFFEPSLADYLRSFGLEVYQIGFMFLIVPIGYGLSAPIVGLFTDKKGYIMTMMISGTLIAGLAFMFIAPAPIFHIEPNLWWFSVSSGLFAIIVSISYIPTISALVVLALESGYPDSLDTSGMISGIMLSSFALGGFAGASFTGVAVEHIGFRNSVFVVGLLLMIDSFFMAIFALVRRRTITSGDIFDRNRALRSVTVKYDEI